VGAAPAYYSALRDRSELWVAREVAARPDYLATFMSCNRAFRQDPAAREATWCGECDKCLFTDLVLSPFVPRVRLEAIFAGREPLGFSMMIAAVLGRDEAEAAERRRAWLAATVAGVTPQLVGTVEQVAQAMREYESAGVQRAMVQHLLHEDLEMVGLLGELARALEGDA